MIGVSSLFDGGWIWIIMGVSLFFTVIRTLSFYIFFFLKKKKKGFDCLGAVSRLFPKVVFDFEAIKEFAVLMEVDGSMCMVD